MVGVPEDTLEHADGQRMQFNCRDLLLCCTCIRHSQCVFRNRLSFSLVRLVERHFGDAEQRRQRFEKLVSVWHQFEVVGYRPFVHAHY